MLDQLALQVPLRPSQRRLVEVASSPAARADRRLHLSAPPGMGKTLAGLELARRLGQPTAVFAPTTTIVEQWREEVGLLLPDGARHDDWVSTDPACPGPLTVLTYQSLAVTDRPDAALRAMARAAWAAELADAGHEDPDDRLASLEAADPDAFARQLRRRATRLRRQRLRDGTGDVHAALHPNARALVDRLVDHGVRTVVLDECHHLLDHWALVLLDLFDRIADTPGPPLHVVGLTATLPEPDSTREQETYAAVMGEVDVEIPTPVVVAEGGLAPYRDLVTFVRPTRAEQAFLDDLAGALTTLVADVTGSEAFLTWLVRQPVEAGDEDAWGAWLRADPLRAGAVLRAHRHLGVPWPTGRPVPADAEERFGLDDQLLLLEGFARDVLQVSSAPEHRRLLDTLVEVLRGFGLSLTSTGLRHGRSPVDLVLARSEAKAHGAADVLAAEHTHLGERLRALVVTDLDRVRTPVRLLRGVLETDAGSARHLHRVLATHGGAGRLDPVLVTGTTVRAGNVLADDLAVHVNLWLAERGLDAWCEARPVDRDTQELVGHGGDWSTRHVVPAVTAAFEDGLTRCLVGTRGLFGQGWDAPSCNTLVDLTSATTATAARQLQGRILRRDPDWPDKAAHRWDVVCVADDVPGGDADLDRFRRRHDRLWGLTPTVDGTPPRVVRGVEHVDPALARALADGHDATDLQAATARSTAAVGDRGALAEAWGAVRVTPHSEVRAVVRARPPRRRAHVAVPPDRSVPLTAVGLLAAGAVGVVGGVLAAPALAGAGAVGAVATAASAWWHRRQGARRAAFGLGAAAGHLRDRDLDQLLAVAGTAVRDALVAAGHLTADARAAEVVVDRADGEATVALSDPPAGDLLPVHHRWFAADVTTLLGPVRTPRYLLSIHHRGRHVVLAAPDRCAQHRDHADALADALADGLGVPVRAIWAHGDEGRDLVVGAWAQRRPPLRLEAEDRWV